MKRTDASHHVGNLFQSGNPLTGQRGTRVDHTWLNAVQEEIARTVEKARIVLDPDSHDQLGDSIESIARRVGVPAFPTLNAAIAADGAARLPADVETVLVKGHTVEGTGAAHYRRTAIEPAHPGRFQDALGQWWVLNEFQVTPQMFGARPFAFEGGRARREEGPPSDSGWALNNATLAAGALGAQLVVPPGRYHSSVTFDASACDVIGIGSRGRRPAVEFVFGENVDLGIFIRGAEARLYENFHIRMRPGGRSCAMLVNWAWRSTFRRIFGTGTVQGTDYAGEAQYGFVMRAQYSNYTAPWDQLAVLDTIMSPSGPYDAGSYWNSCNELHFFNYTYGLLLAGREQDASPPSVNQNFFSACSLLLNDTGISCLGCGGGISFLNVSSENNRIDGMVVEGHATGSSPVFIGGEVTAERHRWVGPGLIVNPASGMGWITPNAEGQAATFLRAVNGKTLFQGTGFDGASLVTNWDDKQDAPRSAEATINPNTSMEVVRVVGAGIRPCAFTLTCTVWDATSPQGYGLLRAEVLAGRLNGQGASGTLAVTLNKADWINDTGASQTLTLDTAVSGKDLVLTLELATTARIGPSSLAVTINNHVAGTEAGIALLGA